MNKKQPVPSISFGDSDTGIGYSSKDTITLVAGGSWEINVTQKFNWFCKTHRITEELNFNHYPIHIRKELNSYTEQGLLYAFNIHFKNKELRGYIKITKKGKEQIELMKDFDEL